jgi:hypothetical protein
MFSDNPENVHYRRNSVRKEAKTTGYSYKNKAKGGVIGFSS